MVAPRHPVRQTVSYMRTPEKLRAVEGEVAPSGRRWVLPVREGMQRQWTHGPIFAPCSISVDSGADMIRGPVTRPGSWTSQGHRGAIVPREGCQRLPSHEAWLCEKHPCRAYDVQTPCSCSGGSCSGNMQQMCQAVQGGFDEDAIRILIVIVFAAGP